MYSKLIEEAWLFLLECKTREDIEFIEKSRTLILQRLPVKIIEQREVFTHKYRIIKALARSTDYFISHPRPTDLDENLIECPYIFSGS
jgi:hypothetical protein